jgi:integrase
MAEQSRLSFTNERRIKEMAKRRANNEGTIYQRPNGKWRSQITIDGRRLSYTANTQKECQQWLKQTQFDIDQGYTFDGVNTSLKDFLDDWLISIKSSRSKGTISLYRRTVIKEIIPILGNFTITDLRPDMIQRYYDQKIRNGQSEHAVNQAHKVLNVALQHAVRLGLLPRNPCKATVPPKPRNTEMSILDEDEILQLLSTARSIKDQYYPLYYLAIHTGMRQAELIGLKWDDLDWDRKTLQVKRQIFRPKGGGFEFTNLKSKSGHRTIILGSQMVEVLKEHRKNVQTMQRKIVDEWTG